MGSGTENYKWIKYPSLLIKELIITANNYYYYNRLGGVKKLKKCFFVDVKYFNSCSLWNLDRSPNTWMMNEKNAFAFAWLWKSKKWGLLQRGRVVQSVNDNAGEQASSTHKVVFVLINFSYSLFSKKCPHPMERKKIKDKDKDKAFDRVSLWKALELYYFATSQTKM